jgi:hypothetical protein
LPGAWHFVVDKDTTGIFTRDPLEVFEQCCLCQNFIDLFQAVVTESGHIIRKECEKMIEENGKSSEPDS